MFVGPISSMFNSIWCDPFSPHWVDNQENEYSYEKIRSTPNTQHLFNMHLVQAFLQLFFNTVYNDRSDHFTCTAALFFLRNETVVNGGVNKMFYVRSILSLNVYILFFVYFASYCHNVDIILCWSNAIRPTLCCSVWEKLTKLPSF